MTDDAQIVQLAAETTAELAKWSATDSLIVLNEARHLDPACKRIAKRLAPTWNPPAQVGPHAFGDKLGWVGLGNVDVPFTWPDGTRTFVELKCGAGSDALSACTWDAVKLAAGVLGGNARAAYLLAGAPARSWQERVPGARFLDSYRWTTAGPDVRDAFHSWWWHWQNETTPHIPGRVPAAFRTTALGTFPFSVEETLWELRLASVEPDGGDWLTWTPLSSKASA